MSSTPKYSIDYLVSSQAQKEVTVNEALAILDALVYLTFLDRDLTSPPGGESDGDTYLVDTGGSGDWNGQDGNIAIYYNSTWYFVTPPSNGWMMAYVDDESTTIFWDGSSWSVFSSLTYSTDATWTEKTISAGVVALTGSQNVRKHKVDTESDAASDDWDSITGGNNGETLVAMPADDARTVVVKHGTLKLQNGVDFTMNSQYDMIVFENVGGTWVERSRSSGGS